jgi:type II secretory pathway component GspD/PulD (secretin)
MKTKNFKSGTKPNKNRAMKKILQLILLAGLAGLSAALAQTNTAPASPAVDLTNTAMVTTNIVISATTNDTLQVVATNVPVASTEAVVTNAAPDGAASTNAPVANGIPLIQFSDVPITTAIENLARQAGINYMLDPKIGYGLPDANGQIKVEPQLSIRWENISPENALLALLDNYGLQLIRDNRTGIARVAPKDPTAPPQLITRVVQLKYASVSNMTEAVQSVLTDKRSKVLPDTRSSQLIVVATDPEQTSVDTLIAQLDKPTRQVLIETRLVEIDSSPTSSKGVNWTGTLNAQHVTFGNGVLSGTVPANGGSVSTTATSSSGSTTTPGGGYSSTTGSSTTTSGSGQLGNIISTIGNGGFNYNTASGLIPSIGFLNADGLSAVISFLNSSSDAQIVSTPRVVTLDNEMASIEVTRGYPVFSVASSSANNSGGSSVAYTNVGTKLQVTPRISANDNIWLKVIPEVSSFFGNFSQTTGGGIGGAAQVLTAPVFDTRTITTQVLIPNADTLVMGGLVKDNPQSSSTKVPILGDIPYLGRAFSSETKSTDKENLLIFITPTIVKDSDFQYHPSTFLQSRPDAKRPQLLNPDSKWDNSISHDWSRPTDDDLNK